MNLAINLPNGSCGGQTIVQRAPVTRRPDRVEGIVSSDCRYAAARSTATRCAANERGVASFDKLRHCSHDPFSLPSISWSFATLASILRKSRHGGAPERAPGARLGSRYWTSDSLVWRPRDRLIAAYNPPFGRTKQRISSKPGEDKLDLLPTCMTKR